MSDRIHFACTVLDITHKGETTRYLAGEVVQRTNEKGAWSHCIISGFSPAHKYGVYVRLHRPYAYADCIGTTCSGVLLGQETFEITAKDLSRHFVKCVGSPMVSGSVASSRPTYDGESIAVTIK